MLRVWSSRYKRGSIVLARFSRAVQPSISSKPWLMYPTAWLLNLSCRIYRILFLDLFWWLIFTLFKGTERNEYTDNPA